MDFFFPSSSDFFSAVLLFFHGSVIFHQSITNYVNIILIVSQQRLYLRLVERNGKVDYLIVSNVSVKYLPFLTNTQEWSTSSTGH